MRRRGPYSKMNELFFRRKQLIRSNSSRFAVKTGVPPHGSCCRLPARKFSPPSDRFFSAKVVLEVVARILHAPRTPPIARHSAMFGEVATRSPQITASARYENGLLPYLTCRKQFLSSLTKRSGCSKAAKWPPLSSSFQWIRCGVQRSAQLLGAL